MKKFAEEIDAVNNSFYEEIHQHTKNFNNFKMPNDSLSVFNSQLPQSQHEAMFENDRVNVVVIISKR